MARPKVKDRGYYRLPTPLNKDRVDQLYRQAKPGSHPVGGSLYLLIRGPGRAYWVHRFRRRDNTYSSQGFGPYPKVTLTQARKKLEAANVKRRNGGEATDNRPEGATGKLFSVARE